MLTSLWHRTVIGRHHQNRPVHLGRSADHVLDVINVSRTVDVRIVPLVRLVLHVRQRHRQNLGRIPPEHLGISLGHLVVRLKLRQSLGR
ncbi:MAG: hypothetical protein OP8BY_2320 [Candidatus Saccharicenans subterraneus]|uniref:Uncharacterized protein n=1 Tax=Candidatus Saccharicenans subterraneus TaxID=2508984 RepID=A0A3E2BMR0_9BACT|nr:MAG: hypothetical protein OP8BY_2320 [Candidatus Saccharicenans subterraneum]